MTHREIAWARRGVFIAASAVALYLMRSAAPWWVWIAFGIQVIGWAAPWLLDTNDAVSDHG